MMFATNAVFDLTCDVLKVSPNSCGIAGLLWLSFDALFSHIQCMGSGTDAFSVTSYCREYMHVIRLGTTANAHFVDDSRQDTKSGASWSRLLL